MLSRSHQKIANNIVLLDGFSGSGKALVSPIIGFLERGEKWQLNEFFETLTTLTYLGEISDENASVLINIEADKVIYNLSIGRNVNFRRTDASSPYFDGTEKLYLNRLDMDEGDAAVNEIITRNPILPLHIHYVFGYSDLLFTAFGDKLKAYIVLLRSPFYLIDKWFSDGWIDRLCKDNRDFQICIKHNNEEVPWYVLEYADEYIASNNIEKSILTIFNLYTRIFQMYNNLAVDKKLLMQFIVFENFIVNPEIYVDKLCDLLNTKRRSDYYKIKEKLSLPRGRNTIDSLSCEDFIEKYNGNISSKNIDKLLVLDEQYKKFIISHD